MDSLDIPIIKRNYIKSKRFTGNPFNFYMNTARKRCKKKNIEIGDINIEYLEELWNKQKGICIYSGIQLYLNTNTHSVRNPIYKASLDRVNSNLGYIRGNLQWVSSSINLMKNTLSNEDTIFLCKSIANYWK